MGLTIKGIFPTRREVEIAVEHLVQDVKHVAVTADDNKDVGFARGHPIEGIAQRGDAFLRFRAVRGHEGELQVLAHADSHSDGAVGPCAAEI